MSKQLRKSERKIAKWKRRGDEESAGMNIVKGMGREICKGDKQVKAVIHHCHRERGIEEEKKSCL